MSALYLGTLLRLAVTAAPVFFCLMAAFVSASPLWASWCGASCAAVSMLWHGWPRAAAIRKTERSLDRAGGAVGSHRRRTAPAGRARDYLDHVTSERDTFINNRLQSLRIFSGSLISALVIFAVVAVVALGLEDYPSPLVAGGLFLLNLLAFGVAELVGYKVAPIAAGTPPDEALRRGLDALQQTTTLRFALTEAPGILALMGAFVTGSAWTYLVGGFWTLLSTIWHVWPSRRIATKLERNLDSEGARSGLSQVFVSG